MTARFDRAWTKASRANLAAAVGLLLRLTASRSARAKRAGPAGGYLKCGQFRAPRG
jgi:hypothetical protein